jgi:hypothetical protein
MGAINSLILVAVGAILTWAVQTEGATVDPQVVGGGARPTSRKSRHYRRRPRRRLQSSAQVTGVRSSAA